jgi:hypothetical protein
MIARFAPILLLAMNSCILTMAEQTLSTRRESFSAEGIETVRFEAGAGFLRITGQSGSASIEIDAEFKARLRHDSDAQRVLDNLILVMEPRGSTFYIKTGQKKNFDWGMSGSIDLEVRVPSATSLDVTDSSGSMVIAAMDRRISIEDGSGSIDIEDVEGNIVIDDGSGSIEVRNAGADLEIEDGSGGIIVRHVSGSVTISDGSGSINVEDVEGDFMVPRAGSGSLRYRDIRGRLDVPKKR